MRNLLSLTLIFGLLTAACTSGDEGGDTTSESTTTEESPVTTETVETTTTTEAAVSTAAPEAGGDDCLVGSWTLDTESFIANFDDIMAEAGMPETEVVALDGTFVVDMSGDGTYVGTRDEWGFSMVTPEGTVSIEINGEESGTWSTDGSTLTVNPTSSDLTVVASVEVDGQEVPLPEGQVPIDTPPGIASNSDFECSGDVLTLTNAGVESVLNRN